MSIRVSCPKCRAVAACPDEYRGKAVRCKKCGQPFVAGAPAPKSAAGRKPVPVPRPASKGLTRGRFLVAALLAALVGVGVGVPAAYVLLKREAHPGPVAAGPAQTAPADGGKESNRHAELPAPSEKPEPPHDTGTKPRQPPRDTAAQAPPPAPVVWEDFTSRDWGFSVRFPGRPQVTSLPPSGGKRPQVFTASVPSSAGHKPVDFTLTCEDHDPHETADAAAYLAARAAQLDPGARDKTPLRLGGFPGLELRAEPGEGGWLTTHRLYVARGRTYRLTASGPAAQDVPSLFRQFFDSFTLLDAGEPTPPTPPPSPVAKAPPKDGVAGLQLAVPDGWTAHYNKFLNVWTVTKPPPTPRSDAQVVRIEECPADARTPADYAAHLKEKDFLNVEEPGWAEVGEREDLPGGFAFRGVVKKFANAKTPPVLGLLAVREIDGLKVRCYSDNLRDEDSRTQALTMFKGATFGPPK